MTVQVSGLMTLDDLSWVTGSDEDVPSQKRFIRADSRSEVVEILSRMVQGDIEKVLSEPWAPFDEITPYNRDLFRAR